MKSARQLANEVVAELSSNDLLRLDSDEALGFATDLVEQVLLFPEDCDDDDCECGYDRGSYSG